MPREGFLPSAGFLDKLANFFQRDSNFSLELARFLPAGFLFIRQMILCTLYTKSYQRTGTFRCSWIQLMFLKVRFPKVIGIRVEPSRSWALVFDFLMVNFFIHTILLWTNDGKEHCTIFWYKKQSARCERDRELSPLNWQPLLLSHERVSTI